MYLIDFAGPRETLEEVLAGAIGGNIASDAVLAASQSQRAALWRPREAQADAQARAGASIKNDISIPIRNIPAFLHEAAQACRTILPAIQVVPFGHLGDGNIHFNLVAPEGMAADPFLRHADAVMHEVSETARRMGGSFSAEHGIGQLKTGLLGDWRGGVEMELMRAIKGALDPAGLLNPGKVIG